MKMKKDWWMGYNIQDFKAHILNHLILQIEVNDFSFWGSYSCKNESLLLNLFLFDTKKERVYSKKGYSESWQLLQKVSRKNWYANLVESRKKSAEAAVWAFNDLNKFRSLPINGPLGAYRQGK